MPVLSLRHGLGALLLALLGFAAAVELLDAAGVLTPGVSGEDPSLVATGVYLGLASAVVAAGAVIVAPWWTRLLPVAAAAFLVARFESYDAYYAPALRRMSDGGLVSPWWVGFLCVAAVAVALLPRARAVAPAVLLVIACTALIANAGH
jgi:hypothetical protein